MFKFGSKTIPADNGERSKILRRLGNTEAYQLALYALDHHSNAYIACRYTPSPNYSSNPNHLKRIVEIAITDVLLLHSILQVGIINAKSKSPAWKQLRYLNLDEHLTWRILQKSEDFDDVSRDLTISEINNKFSEIGEKPGWRIVVLYQETVNLLEVHFTWNQAYADGVSGRAFQEDLFRRLKTAAQQENNEDNITSSSFIPLPPTLNLPPPIEELYKLSLSLLLLTKILWEKFTSAAISRTESSLAHWAPIRLTPYSNQYRSFFISETTLHDIHLTCRKKKSTLVSLLYALMTISLASQLDEKTASALESCTKLDMRRFIPSISSTSVCSELNIERMMGNYESSISHGFDKSLVAQIRDKLPGDGNQDLLLSPGQPRQIWRMGACVRREIERKEAMGLQDDFMEVMKFIGDWRQRIKNASRRPRKFSWLITDAGILNGTLKIDNEISSARTELEGGDIWILHRARFVSSAEITGAALVTSLMAVQGAGLSVGVSWQDYVYNVRMGERVAADLRKWLEQIAEEAYP